METEWGFDYYKFGRAVQRRRERLGVQQQQLAVMLGMSVAGLSRVERAKISDMRMSTFCKLMDFLNEPSKDSNIKQFFAQKEKH